jgi:hypothetical protein
MKKSIAVIAILSGIFWGCEQHFIAPDLTPPVPPQGISTATGDNLVEVFWVRNTEPDLAGYNVYVSNSLNGAYTLLGTTKDAYYLDNGARNGATYFYALTAFDVAGNESPLSRDVAYDTPRPEGYDVPLADYRTAPGLAGYDFSTYSIGQYNDKYTDIFYEYYQGRYYLDVWTDSDIQDMGYTKNVYDIGEAPAAGWSPTKDAQLIAGHTYVIWTWDNHYAKVRVKSISASRIVFDWAYQLDPGNARLKGTTRGAHELGSGARARGI